MKKFLLSILSVLAMTTVARAEVTLSANDAENFDGTLVEEALKEDGSVQAYQHYQPLHSLTIGAYTFTFSSTSDKDSQQPAYYWAKEGSAKSIRLYTGSTMTIAAPAGVTITGIQFNGSNGSDKVAPTVDTGKITYASNKATWTGSASKIAVSTNATWRVLSMTVFTEGETPSTPDTPVPPEETSYKYTLASKIESGKAYAFFASDSVGTTPTKDYGYLYGDPVKEEDGSFVGPEDAAFTFEAVEGGYNIKDYKGRYMIMTGTYNSFNCAETPAEGGLWSVDVAADGSATIVNLAMDKTMMWDHNYHSFGVYPADKISDTMEKPVIYLQGEKTATPGKPDEPEQPSNDATFSLATEVVSGSNYIFVIGEQYATAINENNAYGYLYLRDGGVSGSNIIAPKVAMVTITEVAGKGYTMVDSYGRYLGMDATHFSSFQLYKEETEGCYWNISFNEAGEVVITNVMNPECIVAQHMGKNGTFYENIAPAKAPETYNLPSLYVQTTAGIGAVTIAPANGEAAYFDIQGRRVAADALTPGLYIRRQGGKSVKVLIR